MPARVPELVLDVRYRPGRDEVRSVVLQVADEPCAERGDDAGERGEGVAQLGRVQHVPEGGGGERGARPWHGHERVREGAVPDRGRVRDEDVEREAHAREAYPVPVEDLTGAERRHVPRRGEQGKAQSRRRDRGGEPGATSHAVQRYRRRNTRQHRYDVSHDQRRSAPIRPFIQRNRWRDRPIPQDAVLEREHGAVQKHAARVSWAERRRKAPT